MVTDGDCCVGGEMDIDPCDGGAAGTDDHRSSEMLAACTGGTDVAKALGGSGEVPVPSREVHPPVRKAGGGPVWVTLAGMLVVVAGGGGTWEGPTAPQLRFVEVLGPTEVHPDCFRSEGPAVKPPSLTAAQPGFLKPEGFDSRVLSEMGEGDAMPDVVAGLDILIPAAFAIFLSSFSSRSLSFSFLLSTSSFDPTTIF